MIAFANAGGLGLPDRDYYTKTDAKSQETRQKYVEHVAEDVRAAGRAAARPRRPHAHTVMDIETALAKASLTRVEKRDPYKLFHKMTRAQLQALTPRSTGKTYFKTSECAGHFGDQCHRAGVLQGSCRRCSNRASLADWKTYLRWHLVHAKAPLSFVALRSGQFRFLQQISARRERDAAALEALRAARGPRSGRSAGPGLRREDLRARHQAARPRHDQGNRSRPWRARSSSCRGWARRPSNARSKSCTAS